MEAARLNKALNKEVKYYGLSSLGLIGAGAIGCAVWAWLGMTAGIPGFVIGYGFSSYAAAAWHAGKAQRFIYGRTPFKRLFGGRYLPKSREKCFF